MKCGKSKYKTYKGFHSETQLEFVVYMAKEKQYRISYMKLVAVCSLRIILHSTLLFDYHYK